ncbi:hypothetical protein PMAYCL1PPCAC_20941 [Pristionchus mayeri]|uniref:Uncharacterized protein n=1 Tax=Pristionchus mayeri TaxID=1317129 RepID=A0AAN5I4T1_9BILA|nr:hypothetical protein PMAYCL1PPCAC_20941 [Pristionchus mayeri]
MFQLLWAFAFITQFQARENERIPSIVGWTDHYENSDAYLGLKNRHKMERCPKQCKFIPRFEMKSVLDHDAVVWESKYVNAFDVPK